MKTANLTLADICTEDTYDAAALSGVTGLETALERAMDAGYEPHLDREPKYLVEARQRHCQAKAELAAAGKVAVCRLDGCLHLSIGGKESQLRGRAVEGCDYTDKFVRSMARRLRDGK